MQEWPTGSLPARAIVRQMRRSAVLIAGLGLASCGPSILDPRGYVGAADRQILLDSLAIMLAIIVPVIVAIAGIAWWFRAANARARYMPEFVYSGSIELVVWSIPLMTIMLLGGVAWVGSRDLDPAAPLPSKTAPLKVQVVSLDWKWLFIYPDHGVASVNHLVIPVGTPVHFVLTSGSVMNAFFVPQLGTMIYTMHGMADRLNLIADTASTYYGESAMISGDGFPTMHFDVDAVHPDQFAAWVATAKSNGPTLDVQTYADLAKQSMSVKPFTFRAVDPDLFRKIVTQAVPPGPGPEVSATPGGSGKALGSE
jgi:cytochrome o ubiquinol oxidase subunit 2